MHTQLHNIRIFSRANILQCTFETMPFIVGKKRAKSMARRSGAFYQGGGLIFRCLVSLWAFETSLVSHPT